MFSKLFGGGKNNPKAGTASPAEAIGKLREVETMLYKKQDYLEKKVEEEMEVIRQNGTKNKRLSLGALKRKKRLEKQLEQLDGTLTTIEYQRESLENANTNTEVLKIMNQAALALKGAHDHMDIDKVETLMDEVREQQQLADEISQVISNPTMFGQDVDDDDLMKELEDLEQEEIDRKLLDTEPSMHLPEVPTASPEESASTSIGGKSASSMPKKKEIDDELAELAAWAN